MTLDEFKEKVAPYMNTGFIAKNKDETWTWFKFCPRLNRNDGIWEVSIDNSDYHKIDFSIFDTIEPIVNWDKSLMVVGV